MNQKKAHFIGICGIGMSATATLLQNLGWKISGSDEACYPPASDYLKKHSISIQEGYRAENIPPSSELIVIGKNTKLVPESNKEVEKAFESGVTIRSFAEILGGLANETHNIVVAGRYGKSTCTALLVWCLLKAGKDPNYFIGAVPHDMDNIAHLGDGNLFVFEGDEYPSANWDSESKFLHYNAHDVLLTSVAHDHVNVFPKHSDYLLPFQTLLSTLPSDGLTIVCADEPHALALSQKHRGHVITYGLDNTSAQWGATNILYEEKATFDIVKNRKKIIALETQLLGKHNVQNIVGVVAFLF
jgi:UDP-N-acetylmuramate: L-alanyl-gamma-D-glutamyl-meso-diaminopimelate ligase